VLVAPVLLVAAIAIRATSEGPALHRGVRVGRYGERFTVYKLRSMVLDADPAIHEAYVHALSCGCPADAHGLYKLEDDPRITRVGHWVRRTSIDELPQLLNVLKGDMSLVGPRPPLPEEYATYGPRERGRLDVRPGLTCTWQVSGRSDLDFETWVEMDLEYIRDWSLRRDLVLMAKTVPAVLSRRGAY
jgi:lipopolysaccharide/colanic/teichoic acid biosynthesis glycosyltransferase